LSAASFGVAPETKGEPPPILSPRPGGAAERFAERFEGRHRPAVVLDVAGGVLVGLGAIAILLFACRAAGAAAVIRSKY